MPAFSASAPGKIILFGEHAVVYDRPAIAIPVSALQAKVLVVGDPMGKRGQVNIQAEAIGLDAELQELPGDHPLARLVALVLQACAASHVPACKVQINSSIPVAAGLGSGAAVSVALSRALSAYIGHPLDDEQVNRIAFEVEKIYHGSPSGIDNTVITYAAPVYFQRSQPPVRLQVGSPFDLVIADTGIPSLTRQAVGNVRIAWQADPPRLDALFDRVAHIVQDARQFIEIGSIRRLGELMTANHASLKEMGVSCPELDHLVEAALGAGALGAKLSGGGRGGNMIALAEADQITQVAATLEAAGAVRVISTRLNPPHP